MQIYHENKPPVLLDIYNIDTSGIAREVAGDVPGLATSIIDLGLLHPLHVHKVGDAIKIISGSRRLAAYRYIYENWEALEDGLKEGKSKEYYLNIPAVVHEQMDEGMLLLIEYDENRSREDLTVYEVAVLYQRMYSYWISKEGLKISTARDASGMSHRKLADMLDISQSTVSRFLTYYQMCSKFPELKNYKDATLLARQFDYLNKAQLQANKAADLEVKISRVSDRVADKPNPDTLLAILQSGMTGNPGVLNILASGDTGLQTANSDEIRKDELYKLKLKRLSNSYEVVAFDQDSPPWETGSILAMQELEANSVDFIDCDPPYGVALNEIYEKEYASTIDDYHDVMEGVYPAFLRHLIAELHRVLKPDRRMIFWFHTKYYQIVHQLLSEKFSVVTAPVIWDKGSGPCRNVEYSRAQVYDLFFECSKGVSKLYRQGLPNILRYPRAQRNKSRIPHPAEHPIELMEDIISTYMNPNWPVRKLLVPFLGSGNTILAAANLGVLAYGYDVSEVYRTDYLARLDNGGRLYKSYMTQ